MSLPTSYGEFVKVHNGFLLDGFSPGIRSVNELQRLSDVPALDNREKYMIGYRLEELLEFAGDGGGNAQVFNLAEPIADGEYMTYDWDHESLEIAKPKTFWAFSLELLSRIMESYVAGSR